MDDDGRRLRRGVLVGLGDRARGVLHRGIRPSGEGLHGDGPVAGEGAVTVRPGRAACGRGRCGDRKREAGGAATGLTRQSGIAFLERSGRHRGHRDNLVIVELIPTTITLRRIIPGTSFRCCTPFWGGSRIATIPRISNSCECRQNLSAAV